ncbi:PQQ-dependent sugar dehydrogenase [Pseudoblastomonas halimionae]|uniref:Sorbosone dehydrogenase family protein n=1 Tax=Alteriqipengyuania halimionae TaxID=1926630 RepID=A0A6I4U424_9SPHN|nr:sorbosone dehydrogenase family protein [Alteriqipengyuania halimionae]MXP10859.1 sorbosone dehydrogenase family protein [Alteriqipengyuania halimionae]
MLKKIGIGLLVILLILVAVGAYLWRGNPADLPITATEGLDPTIVEPEAESFPTVGIAEPVGWPDDAAPEAPDGLTVQRFATGLDHPRTILTLPNGDVLVAETNSPPREMGGIEGFVAKLLFSKAGAGVSSANRISLLRDGDGDGVAESKSVLLEYGLDSPSGMAWRDGVLFVANHDELLAFPMAEGATKVTGEPTKLMDLPPAGNHWMRNILLSPDGSKIYVAVGSASNIGENGMEAEQGRATIWEYNLETETQRMWAGGLRNPNGMAWNPSSGELWTVVNERDMLGGDLVPDYLTNVPIGVQYGWPWLYWGDNVDDRVEAPRPQFIAEYTRTPEYALGAHTAPLGLVFAGEGNRLGSTFANGAFVARHGSWNRKPPSGYDVVFVRFDSRGNPTGDPIPVLTGFLTGDGNTYGRPTWLAFDANGALLVTDDTAGIVWRVIDRAAAPAATIERNERAPVPKNLPGRPKNGAFGTDVIREDTVRKGN